MVRDNQSQSPKLEGQSIGNPTLPLISVTFDSEIVDLTLPSPRPFPEPQNEVYRPVFKYIQEKLWPLWTEDEKMHFEHNVAPQICLATKHATKQRFLGRPSDIVFVRNASGIVDITVAFAIWGRAPLEQRANFARLIASNESQLALFPKGPAPGFGQPLRAAKANQARRNTLLNKRNSTTTRFRALTHSNVHSRFSRNHETVGEDAFGEEALVTPCPSLDADMADWVAVRPQRQNRQQVNYADTDHGVELDTFAPVDESAGSESAQHQPVANNATVSEDAARNLQILVTEKEAAETKLAHMSAQLVENSKLSYSEAHLALVALNGMKYDEADEDVVKRRNKAIDHLESILDRLQNSLE